MVQKLQELASPSLNAYKYPPAITKFTSFSIPNRSKNGEKLHSPIGYATGHAKFFLHFAASSASCTDVGRAKASKGAIFGIGNGRGLLPVAGVGGDEEEGGGVWENGVGCHTAIVQLLGRGFVGIEDFGQFWEDDQQK